MNRRVRFALPAIPEENEDQAQQAPQHDEVEEMDVEDENQEDETGWDDQQLIEAAGMEIDKQGDNEDAGQDQEVWGNGWADDGRGPFFSDGGEMGFAVYRDGY